MKGLNKKGESSMLTTVFAIVLGVVVLVILIWGFRTNWNFFSDTVSGNLGTSNANAVISGCQVACETSSKGDYCSNPRTLKFGAEVSVDPKKDVKVGDKIGTDAIDDVKVKQITGTCNYLATNFTSLGGVTIAPCSSVCAPSA